MVDKELYGFIWQEQGAEIISHNKDLPICYRVLAYAVLGDVKQYYELMMSRAEQEKSPICLEAELIIKSKSAKRLSELRDLAGVAREILSTIPDAVFANRFMGYLAENEKNYSIARGYLESALRTNPSDVTASISIARILYLQKKNDASLKLITKIQTNEIMQNIPLTKRIYWYLLTSVYKIANYMKMMRGILVSLAIAVLLLLPGISLPLYLIILIASLLSALYFLGKDNLSLATAMVIGVEASFVFGMGMLLRWLLAL